MSEHSWCQNIPRDEAVRAAEDGRTGPLPTLEEAMDAITQKGNDMATKAEIQAADYRAEATQRPFADSQGTCETGGTRTERVTERRPPEPRVCGNVTGMRTERVTLEITHSVPVAAWDWTSILETYRPGESVRVVEEVHFDDVAQVAMERDAAIRERDNLRAERITQTLTADRFAEAVAEADALRGRVAELESQLESVADRAAAAENRVAELEQLSRQRAAATLARVDELEHRGRESYSRGWNAAITREREAEKVSKQQQATAEMALESAPAASNSSEILTSSPAASGAAGTEAAGTELPTE